MIQPTSITNFSRTREELETFWIFCVLVAGKNSDWAAEKVLQFLKKKRAGETPFAYIRRNVLDLHNMLVANRVGQYARIEKALSQSCVIDIATASLDALMDIHGVGPKTARFFLLHSRQDCKVAVLDVHILRWMREECSVDDAPEQTPTGERYLYLERLFLLLIESKFPGLSVADVDLILWARMSGRI